MLDDLRQYIEQYDRVIWIEMPVHMADDFLGKFCESEAVKHFQGKIMILSMGEGHPCGGNVSCRKLSAEEQNEVRDYYMMYDFSDRFQIISDAVQYGSLLNYVKTGIMTIDEVFKAILA